MSAQSSHPPSENDGEELVNLRKRVDELERELAERRQHDLSQRQAEFRATLYEAVLYGLGRTLSLYDPSSVRVLIREMGRRIREYLEESGYHVGSAQTLKGTIEQIVSFFVGYGFVDLEILSWDDAFVRARWHHLLGLRAYERIVAAGGETFISCPMNAMLHDSLEPFGKELLLLRKEFNLDKEYVESWEEIADLTPSPTTSLTLSAERVLELEREQSRQLRVRDDFIRIASHELSTPLTSTKLALTRLENMSLPEGAAKLVAVLKRQVRRLEHLVTEMLDMTRLQIGRLKLDVTSVDLVQLTSAAIDSMKTDLQRAGSEIQLRGDPSVVGRWDAVRLDQVLYNLLGNAIKYGAGRPIVVDVTARDGLARLVVHDDGIGISADMMKHLFQPFERGASVQHYGGLGLGLHITRRIVQMHGGTISAESEPGMGTTFTVALPLEPVTDGGVLVELPAAGQKHVS